MRAKQILCSTTMESCMKIWSAKYEIYLIPLPKAKIDVCSKAVVLLTLCTLMDFLIQIKAIR